MIVKKETTLIKGRATVTVQIRYDSWEDDYGRHEWTNEVYYRLKDGNRVEEKVVTPQHYIQLSDLFDCPPYFDSTVAHFKKQGFVEISSMNKRDRLLTLAARDL